MTETEHTTSSSNEETEETGYGKTSSKPLKDTPVLKAFSIISPSTAWRACIKACSIVTMSYTIICPKSKTMPAYAYKSTTILEIFANQ